MILKNVFSVVLCLLLTTVVRAQHPLDYSDDRLWYVNDRGGDADIFYVISTETSDWTDARGRLHHQADVFNEEQRKQMYSEMIGVDRRLGGDLSFYSPYYRQATMDVWGDPELIPATLESALTDVRQAFDYYLRHLNHGRPIVLAGFSQGAFAVTDLLKLVPDSVLPRIVATYSIGGRVLQQEVDSFPQRIRLARHADDTGVVICINSLQSADRIIQQVSGGNIACINPVNWRTDATPATIDSLTVRVDTVSHHLLVDGFDGRGFNYVLPIFGKKGNYHSMEVRFYSSVLKENIANRVAAWLRQQENDDELPWPQRLQQRLDRLMTDRLLETTQAAVMVYDLTVDSLLYARNEQQTMRPASTMKVLTAVTALDQLGGNYRFCTRLDYSGRLEGRTLKGDVICTGGMDPAFNNDDLNAFVESLHRLGVDTICGRLVADKSMKDTLMWGQGWCWDDKNPTLSPLLLNRKDNFMEHFATKLRDKGIVIADSLAEQTDKSPMRVNVCSRFHTMDQILMRMMKESDNLYAESMFYQLAASGGVKHASARMARDRVMKLVERLGLGNNSYRVADGSGLSLYNYVSAELEVAMLRHAYRNSEIFNHLYSALPIGGEDGTLRKRMTGTAAAGNVHAKTGTLECVITLAGYCTAANGHRLCFVLLNQGALRAALARNWQDRFCAALCE